MQDTLNQLTALIPANPDLVAIGKFVLILAVSAFVIGGIAKACFGKESNLNRSVCGAIGILFVYALSIVIYTFDPADLSRFLSPLPYVVFSGDKLYLFSFEGTLFPVICSQILSMVILAFLYHVIDDFMPRGKGLHWFIYRILTIVMSMALHYVVTWAMNAFLPDTLVTYAPTVLLVILIAFFFLGALKVLLGLVLAVVNPFLAAVYAFFFSNKVGKQLSKAVLTTFLLTLLVLLLNYFGYSVISVAQTALSAYIPLVLVLLALWFVISHLF